MSLLDAETLSALTALLSGARPPSVRVAAATAAAAATSGQGADAAASRAAAAGHPPLLRRLLALRADAAAGRFALSALVNIAEDAVAAAALAAAGAVAAAADALLDPDQRAMASLYAALLANVTRVPEGVAALTGEGEAGAGGGEATRAAARLLRLAAALPSLPDALFLANACSSARGREVLLSNAEEDPRKQPLNALLVMLRDPAQDRRLAAASALRNCAMDEASHAPLLARTDVLGVALVRLMAPGHPLSEEDLDGAPAEVVAAAKRPMQLAPEPHAEIRLLIVEALLLLCQTLEGRNALRTSKAYPILREWHHEEDDEGVKEALEQIVDRTELLTEEGGVTSDTVGKEDENAAGEDEGAREVEEGAREEAPTLTGEEKSVVAKARADPGVGDAAADLASLNVGDTNALLDAVD